MSRPECGPYCELCGDCLACSFDEDPCYYNGGGSHVWPPLEDEE